MKGQVMNYTPDMTAADKEAESLLLVVPTGDAECPLTVELGRWDAAEDRWEGEWRHTETLDRVPTALSQNDPIAWAEVPEIDAGLYPHAGAEAN
jgi:hypothetical protein